MPDAELPRLRYTETRDTIKDGDVLLFKGKGVLSWLIRVFTRSEYTHAGIALWWQGRLMLLEAVKKGVWAVPLSWRLATYRGTAHLWAADEDKLRAANITLDRARLAAVAKSELGKEYSTLLLVRIARRVIFRVSGGEDPWHPPSKFVCSQYVSHAYREGNLDLIDGEPDEFTTPAHLSRSGYLYNRGVLYTRKRGDDARYLDKILRRDAGPA